jgi:hypothetical protein
MKSLLVLVGFAVLTFSVAVHANVIAIDLTTGILSNDILPVGSIPGHLANVSPDTVTLIGTTGPGLAPSSTILRVALPRQTLDPLPPTNTHYVGRTKPGPVATPRDIDIGAYFRQDPTNYRLDLSAATGVPLADIPFMPNRIPFGGVDLLTVYFETTKYTYALPTSMLLFDTSFTPNDLPGFHLAKYSGYTTFNLNPNGSYKDDVPLPTNASVSFQLLNSDNQGGPSELTISNMRLVVDPTLVADSNAAAIHFFVPEPSAPAILLVGLCLGALLYKLRS